MTMEMTIEDLNELTIDPDVTSQMLNQFEVDNPKEIAKKALNENGASVEQAAATLAAIMNNSGTKSDTRLKALNQVLILHGAAPDKSVMPNQNNNIVVIHNSDPIRTGMVLNPRRV